jgi:O-antigen/teichoic acid export membrane protein
MTEPSAADRAELGALARGGSLNLVGAALSAAANFLLVLVVARGLPQTRAGLFFSITSLFLLAQTVCRLGADVGLVYFVARWRALDQPERLRPGIRAALVAACGAAVVCAAGLLVLARPVSRLLGAAVGTSPVTLIRLLAIVLPVAVGYDLGLAITRGFHRMGPTVLLEKVVRPVAQFVLVLAALPSGRLGLIGAAWVLPWVVTAVLGWFAVHALPVPGAGRYRSRLRREVTRSFWRFTAPRAVAGVAQILLQRLDIVLVAVLRGPADAAVYTAATRFLVVGQLANQALSAPVQPQLSRLLARDDRAAAQAVYQAATAWLVLITWPVYLLAAVFAPTYLALFGHGYRGAASTVVVLSLATLVAAGCGAVDIVLIMAGRTTWNLANTLLALGLNIGLDLLLIPRLGVFGAAIGWAAAIGAANLVPLGQVLGWLRLHPFGAATRHAAVLAAGCFAALPLLGDAMLGGPRGALAGAAVGAAGYTAGLWWDRSRLHLRGLARRGRAGPPQLLATPDAGVTP